MTNSSLSDPRYSLVRSQAPFFIRLSSKELVFRTIPYTIKSIKVIFQLLRISLRSSEAGDVFSGILANGESDRVNARNLFLLALLFTS